LIIFPYLDTDVEKNSTMVAILWNNRKIDTREEIVVLGKDVLVVRL